MNANGLTPMLSVMDCVLLCSYQSNNIVFLASTKCSRWESNNIYVHTKRLKIYAVPTTMLLVINEKDKIGLGLKMLLDQQNRQMLISKLQLEKLNENKHPFVF